MKRFFICFFCLVFCLILCSCGVGNLAKNIMSENEKKDTESPAPAVQETVQKKEKQAPAASESVSAKEESPSPGQSLKAEPDKSEEDSVLDRITENAPAMSILAVLSDSESENFKSFGEPEMKLEVQPDSMQMDTNTIIFTPLQEDVRITIEEVEYRPSLSLSWLDVKKTHYDFMAEMGKTYELTVNLAETIPYFRVSAQWGGRKLSWNCQYDGSGERDVTYLSFSNMEEPMFGYELSYIVDLSGAAAVSYALFEEDEFWESVLYAITLVESTGSAPIILSEERFYQYVEAIHPGATMWPSFPESIDSIITYSEREKTYMLEPYDNEPIGTWELNFLEQNYYGDGGSAYIYVTRGNISEYPDAYEVVWARNKNRGIDDPFAFCIVDIIYLEPVG